MKKGPKPSKDKPVVIAVISDTHAGSTVAVCPPSITLDDGGEYSASKAQLWLWQNWLAFWELTRKVVKTHDAELYCVFNGDVVDGDHHGTTQILSGNPNAQAAVVNALISVPLSLKPDRLFFVRGTEAHAGKSGSAEERIADGLRRDKRPVVGDSDTGTASHWYLRLEVHGKLLAISHHGRLGMRPWTRINVAANLAAEIFYEHAARGVRHPDLAIRSHLHRYADTFTAHPVRLIQTGAWQLHTAFIHRIAPDSLADIGGLIVVVHPDGRMDIEPILYKPKPAPVWKA